MGTSNPAILRALQAARNAQAASTDTDTLGLVLTESRRAADNTQYLRDALMGEPVEPETPEPEPVDPTEPEVTP